MYVWEIMCQMEIIFHDEVEGAYCKLKSLEQRMMREAHTEEQVDQAYFLRV